MSTEEIQKDQAVEQDQVEKLDVAAQIDKIKADLEAQLQDKFKTEIAGLNRKNSELMNVIKEKELEGKSEAEQKEMLLKEKENILKEIEALNRGRLVDQELNNAGLPLDFAKRIIGEDEANIKEDIRNFGEYVDKLAQEKADKIINERMGGKAPESGQNPPIDDSIDKQIQDAQKAGDFARVMYLRDQKKKQLDNKKEV